MAQLHFDGFDMGILPDYQGTANPLTNASTAFGYGLCMSATGNGVYVSKTFGATAEVFVGFRYQSGVNNTTQMLALFGDTNATEHIRLWWSNSTTLTVGRGATSIATAAVPEPVGGSWAYIEVRVVIADSGGRVVVRIDGVTVIDFTGDTKNAGTNTSVDAIRLYGANGVIHYFDDLYLNDATGSAPHNTFYGPVRVYALAPTAAGTDTQFTPSSGANWAAVDEQPYSATDYVSATTVGTRDTYVMADLPNSVTTVLGVRPTAVAKANDASPVNLKTATRSGGTVYTGTSTALGPSDSVVSNIRSVDPATGVAWTLAGVNAAEAGFEVA